MAAFGDIVPFGINNDAVYEQLPAPIAHFLKFDAIVPYDPLPILEFGLRNGWKAAIDKLIDLNSREYQMGLKDAIR